MALPFFFSINFVAIFVSLGNTYGLQISVRFVFAHHSGAPWWHGKEPRYSETIHHPDSG